MALTTVARCTIDGKDGGHVALCSCGWEGHKTTDRNEAYREKQRHTRSHREDVTRG